MLPAISRAPGRARLFRERFPSPRPRDGHRRAGSGGDTHASAPCRPSFRDPVAESVTLCARGRCGIAWRLARAGLRAGVRAWRARAVCAGGWVSKRWFPMRASELESGPAALSGQPARLARDAACAGTVGRRARALPRSLLWREPACTGSCCGRAGRGQRDKSLVIQPFTAHCRADADADAHLPAPPSAPHEVFHFADSHADDAHQPSRSILLWLAAQRSLPHWYGDGGRFVRDPGAYLLQLERSCSVLVSAVTRRSALEEDKAETFATRMSAPAAKNSQPCFETDEISAVPKQQP